MKRKPAKPASIQKEQTEKAFSFARGLFFAVSSFGRKSFHSGRMKNFDPNKPDLTSRNADLEIKQAQAKVSIFSALPHFALSATAAALGWYMQTSMPGKVSVSLPKPFSGMFRKALSFDTAFLEPVAGALFAAALGWAAYKLAEVLLQKVEANGRRMVYSHGVFSRTEDMMEIFSIHQVDVTRNLFELVFGMATLQVELKREGWVKLRNLKNREAQELKKFIWAVARDSYVEHAYLRDRDRNR